MIEEKVLIVIAAFPVTWDIVYCTLLNLVEYWSTFSFNLFHNWIRKRQRSILLPIKFSKSDNYSDYIECRSSSESSNMTEVMKVTETVFWSNFVWRMFRFFNC